MQLLFFVFVLFLPQNKNRINKAGELLVTSELSRSQQRNLSDCIQKISDIVAEAIEKPHEPSLEDIALRKTRYSTISSSNSCLPFVHAKVKCFLQIGKEKQGAPQSEEDQF